MRKLLIITTSLGICAAPALAQVDDEIIVTAGRVEQDASSYAGSVAVIDTSDLTAETPAHPAELLNTISGVHIHRGSGQEHLTSIRSPVLTGGAGAGSFLYLEDSVPLRASGFANVNGLFEAMTEISSGVEVAKGPGTVFYGSNALHGLVNVLSKDPTSGDNSLRVLAGEDGYLSAALSVSSDHIRASLSLAHDNGFRDASGFDQQKLQIRHDTDYGPWRARWLFGYQNLNQETAGFIQGVDAYRNDTLRFTNPNPEAYRDGTSVRGQIRLERDLEDSRTLTITPYMRWTELEFLRHFVPGQAREENGHWSAGVLSTLYGKDYSAGIDVEYTSGFLDEFQDNPSRFSFIRGAHYDYGVDAIVAAAYGEKTFSVGSRTALNIGARAEYTRYDYDNKINSGVFGRFRRVDDRTDDFLTITPRIGLTHQISESLTAYASAARGARAPQTSDLYSIQINQLPGEAKSETLDSLEAGLKGRMGGFKFDAAIYHMWKDNFFFRNANGFNVIDGKTRHLGAEVSAEGKITDWLSISANLSLADHTYAFTDIVGSASSSITDGDKVDTAPDTLANITLSATPTDTTKLNLSWRHVGSYVLDPGNTRDYPGHDVFVLGGEWKISDAIMLFGRVDNLFDVKYADRADFAFGNERYFPGRPRSLFFGFTSRF